MPVASATGVEHRPIDDADIDDVARFLHRNMNSRIAPAQWANAMRSPWQGEVPNHGFHVRVDGAVVGAYLALYVTREIDGRAESFCNMAAWCVLEQHRGQGLKLMRALLRQRGYHFVDLSPSGNVIPLNERLGFEHLDTRTAVALNVPWRSVRRRQRVVADPDAAVGLLSGPVRQILLDHRDAPAAHQVVVVHEGRPCLVVFRRVRRKNLPLFVAVLYVSDRDVFGAAIRTFLSHVLLRHGAAMTLLEPRIVGEVRGPVHWLRAPRPKMFKSATLRPDQIDDLYSELVALRW